MRVPRARNIRRVVAPSRPPDRWGSPVDYTANLTHRPDLNDVFLKRRGRNLMRVMAFPGKSFAGISATEVLLYALLVCAICLGGSAGAANLRTLPICLVSAALIATTLGTGGTRKFWELPRILQAALGLILLVPLLQLIPLPSQVWNQLPGREVPRTIVHLIGTENNWHPLSLMPQNTLFGFLMLIPPYAAFLGMLALDERGRERSVLFFLVLVALSVAVGLVQLSSSGDAFNFYDSAHRGNLIGFFANRNHEGLLLVFGAVFGITLIARRVHSRQTGLAWVAIISLTFVAAVVGTISRAALGLMLFALAASIYASFFRAISRKHIFMSVGVVLMVAILIYFLSFSSVVERALARFNEVGENDRWEIWRNSWPLVTQYFPWGSGIGTFVPAYAATEPLDTVSTFYVNSAHNEYLALLIETGLPGIAALLAFGLALVLRAFGAVTSRNEWGAFGLPAALAILCTALHSIVDYPLRTPALAVAFGMILALYFSGPDQSDRRQRRRFSRRQDGERR